MFAEVDSNCSGDITAKELQSWLKEARNFKDEKSIQKFVKSIWEWDKDQDDLVTWDEWQGPKSEVEPVAQDEDCGIKYEDRSIESLQAFAGKVPAPASKQSKYEL